MRNKSLKNAILPKNVSVKEAMRAIDLSGLRVAYIVDTQDRVIGAVSDSEIRRAILKGMDIRKPVENIINPHPVLLAESELADPLAVKKRIDSLLARMPDCRYILIIDDKDKPLRLAPCSELTGQKKPGHRPAHSNGTKHILVVGGAGYLGSVLVRKLLSLKFKVRVLDNLMYGADSLNGLMKESGFELIEGDMRNISILLRSLADIDAVINLAAIVGDPACNNKPEMAIETNYLANKALAEACRYHQINRFIYASTCSVYGAAAEDEKLDENSPLNPVSLYARSKIQSEEGILSLEDENFSPTILRMSTLCGYSPRMRFDLVVNTMTKTALIDKKIAVFAGGTQWRPLLSVEDASNAYLKCLQAPLAKIKGEIFNVGASHQNYQIIEIARTVKRCIPQAELLVDGVNNDARNYFVSFSKIEKQLKYSSTRKLEEVIMDIKKAIERGEFKDPNCKKYYNVEYNK